jgi:hypothetical protein
LTGELEEFYYPGSSTPRKTVTVVPSSGVAPDDDTDAALSMLGESVSFTVAGVDVEFFYIGQLAAALGRSATTLRRWESDGTIPKSGYIKPSKDPRGRRRLYTRAQAEGIVRLAVEEGLLDTNKIAGTNFSARVEALFKALKGNK